MTDAEKAVACLDELAGYRCEEYADWLKVGMILKSAGASATDWDSWSAASKRYKAGVCARKWNTFQGDELKIATLVEMVKEDGGTVPANGQAQAYVQPVVYGWDSPLINPMYAAPAIDTDLVRYLSALYKDDECVNYVLDYNESEPGKFQPASKGTFHRTSKDIRDAANDAGSAAAVHFDASPAGGWIRINPIDGKGVKKENVTEYRHTLIECDTGSKEDQLLLYRKLRLPCAAIVDSGGKSVHAIVRVDAGTDYKLYRKRVGILHDLLKENGAVPDGQPKSPNTLSRLPGIHRGAQLQQLISVNEGASTWDEWLKLRAVETAHDMPEFERLTDVFHNPPPLSEEIISQVLRRGHKMLLSGSSKASKSFALIQLSIAVAEGGTWFGHDVKQGRVLYCNLELDRASFIHRQIAVYKAMQLPPDNINRITTWQLRGRAMAIDNFVPCLIAKMQDSNFDMVIVDPIYKLNDGDENSAGDMGRFCNQLDRLCVDGNTSVVFASHFAKGDQSQKSSMDRTSGSGVLARDPDAIITMTEITDDDSELPSLRLEYTLREFAGHKPAHCWFQYPTHLMDNTNRLAAAPVTKPGRPQASESSITEAIGKCTMGADLPTVQDVATYMDLNVRTVRRRLNDIPGFMVKNNQIHREAG